MSEEPKKKVRKKVKSVRVVSIQKEAAVVEFESYGKTCRKIVPKSTVKNGKVAIEELELGIDYGVPWESELVFEGTPEDLAEKLRAAGIWTAEDATRRTRDVVQAIQSFYRIDLSTILRIAHKHKAKEVK